jgi:hypothetical protein
MEINEALQELTNKGIALGRAEISAKIRDILSDYDKQSDYPDLVQELWELIGNCGVIPQTTIRK